MIAGVGGTRRRWSVDRLVRLLPVLLLLAILAYLWLNAPSFFTTRNVVNILVQSAALGVMAIGLSLVLIGGGIDLSLPGAMALSAIAGGSWMQAGGSPVLGCVLMLATGAAIGCVNGLAVAYLGMIPFVVTLATMIVVKGAAIWVTNAVSIAGLPDSYFDAVLYRIGGVVPVPVVALILLAALAALLTRRSLFGAWLYAVGTNPRAARVSGVPVARVLFGTYLLSGLSAGLTAVILAARLGSASANMGTDGVVLDVVSSAVVGGVSIYGGVGGPVGAVLGAVLITVISNSLNMLGVSFFVSLIVKGTIIVAFVAFDDLRRRERT